MSVESKHQSIELWLAEMYGKPTLSLVSIEQMSTGQSNETYLLCVDIDGHIERLVLRSPPAGPGLVEPYDMKKQFLSMTALKSSEVPVPNMRWLEESGDVIGTPFFVMDYLNGTVFELSVPEYVREGGPELLRTMSTNFVKSFVDLHKFDWTKSEVAYLDGGPGFLRREIEWWRAEIERVRLGATPALDQLCDYLVANIPSEPSERALIHGDAKWGNVMWNVDQVVGVLDFEMAQIGDPLVDIGYATLLWELGGPSALPGMISSAEFLDLYESLSGLRTNQIEWYQALAAFKIAAICLGAAMLFASGKSDSLRYAMLGCGVEGMVYGALKRVGIDDPLPIGFVTAKAAQVASRVEQVVHSMLLPELQSEVSIAQALALPYLFRFYTETVGRS